MHLAKIRPKGRMTSPSLALGRDLGLNLPRQAYLPGFTVSLSNPGTCTFYDGSYPSESSLVGSHLKVIPVNLTGGLTRKLSSTITPPIPQNDSLIAYFGIPRRTVTDNCNPGFAASLALSPITLTGIRVPSGNLLNHLARFSSGWRMKPKWRKQTELSRALKTSYP